MSAWSSTGAKVPKVCPPENGRLHIFQRELRYFSRERIGAIFFTFHFLRKKRLGGGHFERHARVMRTLSAPLASRAPGLTARARVTPRRGARTAAPVRAALDKNGRRDYYAENYEYYKDKEITNAMLVGALVPAVASCAASFQLAMSAEATAAWFMSAAGLANGVEILDMEYST